MHTVPGHVVNMGIAKYLSPKNILKLKLVSKNLNRNVRRPSQMKTAKSMLGRRAIKPVTYKISRMTNLIPAHMPNGKYTRGHRTIQNLLNMYAQPHQKKAQLKMVQNKMEKNIKNLPEKVKTLFNRLLKNRK